jgi:hypothetical protein
MVDIAIESDSREIFDELTQIAGLGKLLATEKRGMDGATLYTAVLTLTSGILAAVAGVVRAQIAAKKHVRVTRRGMVIRGVSEKTLLKLLENEQNKAKRS